MYLRFTLSLRDVGELLAERGITVTVRVWVARFGPLIAECLRLRRRRSSGIWHLDEMFVRIAGRTIVAPALHQQVQHLALAVDRTPQIHAGAAFRVEWLARWMRPLAYNLANFLRSLALPDEVAQWSLTTGDGGSGDMIILLARKADLSDHHPVPLLKPDPGRDRAHQERAVDDERYA